MSGPSLVVAGDLLLEHRSLVVDPPLPGQGRRATETRTFIGGHAGIAAGLLAAGRREDGASGETAVRLAASVGDDVTGHRLTAALRRLGVDVSASAHDPGLVTGFSIDTFGPEAGADPSDGAEASLTGAGMPVLVPTAPPPGHERSGDVAAGAARTALSRTRPGDALLLDGAALGRLPEVVEEAWQRDVQIVVDCSALPWPSAPDLGAFARVDVAVVAPTAARHLADTAASVPASMLLLDSAETSWDGEIASAPAWVASTGPFAAVDDPSAHGAPSDVGCASRERRVAFCAGLAAALAGGADRPEALEAAWRAWAAAPARPEHSPLSLDVESTSRCNRP